MKLVKRNKMIVGAVVLVALVVLVLYAKRRMDAKKMMELEQEMQEMQEEVQDMQEQMPAPVNGEEEMAGQPMPAPVKGEESYKHY